jgi:metal-responsive CopG/Arc/MetJ family transcriptional regulator
MELPTKSESKTISLPSWLWELIDDTAQEMGIDRSAFIQKACRKLLADRRDTLREWERVYKERNGESC